MNKITKIKSCSNSQEYIFNNLFYMSSISGILEKISLYYQLLSILSIVNNYKNINVINSEYEKALKTRISSFMRILINKLFSSKTNEELEIIFNDFREEYLIRQPSVNEESILIKIQNIKDAMNYEFK